MLPPAPAPSREKPSGAVPAPTTLQASATTPAAPPPKATTTPPPPATAPAQPPVKPSTLLSPAPAQFGKVTIRARPVPLVTIDGVRYGDKAIVDLPLGAGPHTATLVCDPEHEPTCEQVSQRTHTIQFTVKANEAQTLKHIFK